MLTISNPMKKSKGSQMGHTKKIFKKGIKKERQKERKKERKKERNIDWLTTYSFR